MIEEIIDCLESVGVITDGVTGDTDLMELLEESVMFISFIIEIENHFQIEVGDEYFMPQRLGTVNDVIEMVKNERVGVTSDKLII